MKFKKDEIKAKLKKHAPELILGAVTVVGTVGWIVAGIYAGKVRELERVDAMTAGWPHIKIHPESMEKVENGAILTYRQKRINEHNLRTQHTTRPGGFSDRMNQIYENGGM